MHRYLVKNLLFPRSADEDSRRKEFILNVLLASSIALFSLAIAVSVLFSLLRPEPYARNSVSLHILIPTFVFFLSLFILSRKGFSKGSAHILVLVFFSFAFLMGYRWGVDVNASLLIYGLVIVMAGILVDTRFAFIMTALVGCSLFILGFLQSTQALSVDRYWRTESWEPIDTIMTVVIFFVIATVSWLSNREIERSLARAHRSEATLRKERDELEVTVEERTRKLRETQVEKVNQLYRFAEFGRLSSGLFHDLMNPLTAVSLNMEKARTEGAHTGSLSTAELYLEQAFSAAKRMERFISAVRRQITKDDKKKKFSLGEETKEVMEILSYKAHVSHVRLVLQMDTDVEISGIPIKWNQIMLNLVTNGIDAYDGIAQSEGAREVVIRISEDAKDVVGTVTDYGAGIKPQHLERIFEPFFTTKAGEDTKGTGIGLSMVRTILEKDFNGTIGVISNPEQGTVFSLRLQK